jgi:hypothetical protein
MRRTLIAIATAGVFASGAAIAGSTTAQLNHQPGYATFVPVQYSYDRWDHGSVNINEREARIRARIDGGLNDGRITRWEARRLYRELASIEAKERSYKSDGRLNNREEAQLNRDLDWLAENVRTQLRDDDRSYSYNNPYGR